MSFMFCALSSLTDNCVTIATDLYYRLLSQLSSLLCSGDSDIVDIEEDSNADPHSGKRRDTGSPLSDVGSLSDIGDSDASQSAANGNPLSHSSSHLHPHHTIPLNKPRIWSIVDTATSNNSSSLLTLPPNMSLNKGLPTNPSAGLGPISPSAAAIAANRAARLDYLSPYSKPGAPHWYNPGNFGAAPPGAAFSPLYPCPPSAIMSHLSGAPPGHTNVPPHIAAAAAESSLNRLRSAAAAVAGASLTGSSTDNIAAINKTITSIGERTLSATNGSKS